MRLSKFKIFIVVCILMSYGILFHNFDEKCNLWKMTNIEVESEELYTPITYAEYENILMAANRLKWNPFARSEDLVNVADQLFDSIQRLELRPDKTELMFYDKI